MKAIFLGQLILLFGFKLLKCQATFCSDRGRKLEIELNAHLLRCCNENETAPCCEAEKSSLNERKKNHAIICPSLTDNIFKILPSRKIVIDSGDDIMVTCRYNGDCDALLYKKGDRLNPIKQLKRSKKKQCNIIKSTKELTWKYQNFLRLYGGIYICKKFDCTLSTDNGRKAFEIEAKGPSPPTILLLDNPLKKVTVNSNTSFRLKLTGSPMPQMSCILHNGEQVIFCSSEDMKKVMYDNPSRPCKSSDLHYQIRSEEVQTDRVAFDIIKVTFARDNGSTIYCYWKYEDGAEKNISMKIAVTD